MAPITGRETAQPLQTHVYSERVLTTEALNMEDNPNPFEEDLIAQGLAESRKNLNVQRPGIQIYEQILSTENAGYESERSDRRNDPDCNTAEFEAKPDNLLDTNEGFYESEWSGHHPAAVVQNHFINKSIKNKNSPPALNQKVTQGTFPSKSTAKSFGVIKPKSQLKASKNANMEALQKRDNFQNTPLCSYTNSLAKPVKKITPARSPI